MEKIVSIGFNISHSPHLETIARIGDKVTLKDNGQTYLVTKINDKPLIGAVISKEWINLRAV